MSLASTIMAAMNQEIGISNKAKALMEYCVMNDRVCPKRRYWNQLWVIAANAKTPPSCLDKPSSEIITSKSTDLEKAQRSARLRIYIRFADRSNFIDSMDEFIRSIPNNEWHYFYEE